MPDFCRNSNVLLLIVFVFLAALLVELIQNPSINFDDVALTAVYLSWIVLSCAAFLCYFRRYVQRDGVKKISKAQWGSLFGGCLLLFSIMELGIQHFFYHNIDVQRFMRFGLIAVIVLLVVFRAFSLLDVFRVRAQAETVSHLRALQSRIEPHFLFNSLNTIAELTHVDPSHAEEAIQSLSLLIRDSLTNDAVTHSLNDEIRLCQQYLQLEKWRLGERLEVVWDMQINEAEQVVVPKVLIQPLIENAIVHGIAPAENGGILRIKLSEHKKYLAISVENESALHGMAEQKTTSGLGIALQNIKERLFVLYDDQHRFTTQHDDALFTVLIELPKQYNPLR